MKVKYTFCWIKPLANSYSNHIENTKETADIE